MPESGSKMMLAPNDPLVFGWKPSPGAVSYEFLLAKDPFFENPILKRAVKDSKIKIDNLPEGDTYWKILARDRTGKIIESSAVSTLAIAPPIPVVLMRPSKGTVFPVGSSIEQKTVEFRWEQNSVAKEYIFQLSGDVN
ncbi:hypothetical protein EBZ37_15480, partial [bacterium]|nr:hypothetical protein [bacterium]